MGKPNLCGQKGCNKRKTWESIVLLRAAGRLRLPEDAAGFLIQIKIGMNEFANNSC
jgi:hypothetical protein